MSRELARGEQPFAYTMKAIPTAYAGVNFRSRLEARWAAFFDLAGWRWDYEPIDLEGWCPDFLINTTHCDVWAEVKPVGAEDWRRCGVFEKTRQHWSTHQVMLLGVTAIAHRGQVGILLDPPECAAWHWCDVYKALQVSNVETKWREAGNRVQWNHPSDEAPFQIDWSQLMARVRAKQRAAA